MSLVDNVKRNKIKKVNNDHKLISHQGRAVRGGSSSPAGEGVKESTLNGSAVTIKNKICVNMCPLIYDFANVYKMYIK